jgi:NAD+ synthase (glutamine-hydrolysing)
VRTRSRRAPFPDSRWKPFSKRDVIFCAPCSKPDRLSALPTMNEALRVRLISMKPRKGDVEGNLAMIRRHIADACGEADLLVFAETVVSGYFVEGGVEDVARHASELARALGEGLEGAPDVIFGAYERSSEGVLYNTAFHFTPSHPHRPSTLARTEEAGWDVVHLHRKMFLPTYGLFDEARFVKPGLTVESYASRFGRMGMLICEEMLHSLPPTILALDGAELVVALSASPIRELHPGRGLPATLERWDVAARAITLEHGIYLALGHLNGSEGGKLFAGGSAVYGPGGSVLGRAPLFSEDVLDVPVALDAGRRARVRSPMLEDLRTFLPHVIRALEVAGAPKSADGLGFADRLFPDQALKAPFSGSVQPPSGPSSGRKGQGGISWNPDGRGGEPDPADPMPLELDLALTERALVEFLRDEVTRRRGFNQVVVGVSGGVDSAVTLALAVQAFSAPRVHAFFLPDRRSSSESLEHGREVCQAFGVEGREIPIGPGVDAYVAAEEPDLSPLRRGNLAARYRAMVLWDQAARHEALILGTGNKSERLLGYFTWHADDSPPLNPLGDLLKSQVWALAAHLGVPQAVISKPPSADLVPGVHDEDELGVPYRAADLVLHWLLAGISPEQLLTRGFDATVVKRVSGRLASTHWKRSLPTSALLTGSAIGAFYLRPVDF